MPSGNKADQQPSVYIDGYKQWTSQRRESGESNAGQYSIIDEHVNITDI
jgi:hypothetical protein